MSHDHPTVLEVRQKLREINQRRIEHERSKPPQPRQWSAAEQRARAYPQLMHRRFDASRQARRRAIRGG
jgi:hypothetical protein